MKRLAGILFISVYMLAFAEFHQLMRIPFLIEHFNVHRQADPELSFSQFLNMHYMGPVIVDDDFMQDQQLPFRDAGCHTLLGSAVCSFAPPSFMIEPPAILSAEFYSYNEIKKPQFSSFDIFQPPRCA
ncbi:MAG TPA: hypothetical protein VHN59_03445 [Chitinophagaceae bacterium]|nr:hypothetical protein [Chitinophagaceae bacterium]